MVDHIDEDKTNNCADNLRWVTRSENNNKLDYPRFYGRHRPELTTDEERLKQNVQPIVNINVGLGSARLNANAIVKG